jgi:two-component system, LytTR family, response regulator
MRALIVEDEAVAARSLQRLLAEVAPALQVVAVTGSVADTVDWWQRSPRPDVVFLDVQLSDGLSFEVFDQVAADVPVIFTTAHDEFALRAFAVFGIDYLLKPIDPARLAAALGKLPRMARAPGAAGYRQRFLLPHGARLEPVTVDRIAWFEKALVVRLVTVDGRGFAMSQSLDQLQQALDPACFVRLNRQLLVHRQAIVGMVRAGKGRLAVRLHPEPECAAVVSQERAAAFREWLDG